MKFRPAIFVTIIGSVIPGLLALLSLPLLNQRLGTEIFGFFMIAWTSIGLSSLLDLGVGRAISHFLARQQSKEMDFENDLVSASVTMLGIIAVGVTCFALLAWLIIPIITVSLKGNSLSRAIFPLVFCIPMAILTSGVRSMIEGAQLFIAAAILRTLSGLIFILVPSIVAFYWRTPVAIGVAFLAARTSVFLLYIVCERHYLKALKLRSLISVRLCDLQQVAGYCGWISLSSLLGGILGYLDRIALAIMAPLTAAAHYSAPFELVSRILVIPGSVGTVLIPKISASRSDFPIIRNYVRSSYIICAALVVPLCLVMIVFARHIMAIWMGDVFATNSFAIMRIIGVGIVLNSMAQIPLAALQAIGKPDVAAKIYLIEIIPSVLFFYIAVNRFGPSGAAMAWTIRAGVDWLLFHGATILLERETQRI